MEIIYVEGDSLAFKAFIDEHIEDIELRNIEGHNRWVIKNADGSESIVRPESTRV